MKLVLAGGGTGGHIFAGVAVAEEFISRSRANQVLFIGSEYGLEARLVPKAGYPLALLKVGKLVGQGLRAKLLTLIQIPIAVLKAIYILKKCSPDFVLGVGGYAAAPAIIAAWILRIPIGVLEQNALMGLTNRICARLATFVFQAFETPLVGVEARKCQYTGNPIRSQLKPAATKVDDPFVIFIFGGSQGAHGINRLMVETAPLLNAKKRLHIVHQTGPRDLEWVRAEYAKRGVDAEVHAFIDNMQAQYERASLVIARAGSGTLSELAATQNAAILIPLPTAAANHQELNARELEKKGAAKVLPQNSTSAMELKKWIELYAGDSNALRTLRENVVQFHRPDAAQKIVGLIQSVIYQ